MSDTAMMLPTAGIGRVQSGRASDDAKYSNDTRLQIVASTGQLQKYAMYRRLQRAGIVYVSTFDTYLTALTDMCRVIEQILQYEDVTYVEKLADAASNMRMMKFSE